MDVRQLRFAVRLSETLHFGRAAELEHIAQSAFSHQIARLEQELGTRLFTRDNRRVEPTIAGLAFVERARQLLDQLDVAVSEARKLSNDSEYLLRVGLFGEAAGELTHLIFSAYSAAYPRVRLEFTELTMVNQLQALKLGEVDVAILRSPIFDDQITLQPMFSEPRVAVVPQDHELAAAESLRISDLVDEAFAVAAEGAPSGWGSYWSFDDQRGEPSRVAASVRSIGESLAAVAYSGAVDTFPGTASRQFPHPGVRYIPLADADYSTIGLATMRGDNRVHLQALGAITRQVVSIHLGHVPGAVPPE